jgi:dsDNA-specific endonuclease/ATPase MutS2
LQSRSRIILVDPEPQRDAAPNLAPNMDKFRTFSNHIYNNLKHKRKPLEKKLRKLIYFLKEVALLYGRVGAEAGAAKAA